ncbi:uncharacterized protein LOC125501830 [Athalia rosae]|uniref:uncharacterized protein LOC125501830 n=1 Tax=Athalia rosae TaxID=37344 RepID=UPI002034A209|nr:uncharacterized protein LOC125501830 [Athalia rosae]
MEKKKKNALKKKKVRVANHKLSAYQSVVLPYGLQPLLFRHITLNVVYPPVGTGLAPPIIPKFSNRDISGTKAHWIKTKTTLLRRSPAFTTRKKNPIRDIQPMPSPLSHSVNIPVVSGQSGHRDTPEMFTMESCHSISQASHQRK